MFKKSEKKYTHTSRIMCWWHKVSWKVYILVFIRKKEKFLWLTYNTYMSDFCLFHTSQVKSIFRTKLLAHTRNYNMYACIFFSAFLDIAKIHFESGCKYTHVLHLIIPQTMLKEMGNHILFLLCAHMFDFATQLQVYPYKHNGLNSLFAGSINTKKPGRDHL